jgi:uncharacterized protein YjbJ (UPF0337 family)
MDENRISGTARNIGGKAQEGAGRIAGDAQAEAEGIANQIGGKAQDLYGQARDAARTTGSSAKESVITLDALVRNTVETQPYMAAAVALGIGWLLGRMHRPF